MSYTNFGYGKGGWDSSIGATYFMSWTTLACSFIPFSMSLALCLGSILVSYTNLGYGKGGWGSSIGAPNFKS